MAAVPPAPNGDNRCVPNNPNLNQQLGKQARLWALSLICATVGALVVWRTGQFAPGILAFLAAVVVLGAPLWLYERSRGKRPAR